MCMNKSGISKYEENEKNRLIFSNVKCIDCSYREEFSPFSPPINPDNAP